MHWAIFSPSLLSYPFCTDYIRDEAHEKAVLKLLSDLDADSEVVNHYFNSLGNLPMGKYFEQLLFYVLERDQRFEVILKNQQLKSGNQTIGEIDLILKDKQTGVVEHWEIALKYYLQSEQSAEHEFMLGPNAIDSLDRKMKKLTEKQLPIKADLSEFGISSSQSMVDRLFIKGQFFYNLAYKMECNIFPNAANPSHEKGWWCYLSEMESIPHQDLKWTTIWKPNWTGTFTSTNTHKSLSFNNLKESLEQHFKDEVHSILCVGLQLENGQYNEVTRGFVVNNDWPNGSKKS